MFVVYRSDLLDLFGQVLLMSKGQMVYFGEATNMVDYFRKLGFPCPELTNPCDYYGKSELKLLSHSAGRMSVNMMLLF